MKSYIDIKTCDIGTYRRFNIPENLGYTRIFVDNVVCIDIFMRNFHKYGFQAYFFKDRLIYSLCYYRTKKEMIGAIQKLLQELL